MKKIIAIILMVATLLSWVSCGKKELQAEMDRLKIAYEEVLKENESQEKLVDKVAEENTHLKDLLKSKEEELKQKEEETESLIKHELILVDDEKTKAELLDYQFGSLFDDINDERWSEYTDLTDYLWEGDKGKPYKTTTCLTEFTAWEDAYYLVYIDDSTYQEVLKWGKAFEESTATIPGHSPFSSYDDEYTIDGKYFYMLQELDKFIDHILVLKSRCYINISRIINGSNYSSSAQSDMRLIFCVKRKQMTIKENIITGEIINKTINLYARDIIRFINDPNYPRLTFSVLAEDESQALHNGVEEYYAHVGEAIGVYRNEFFSQSYANLPRIYKLDDNIESSLCFTTSIRIMSILGKKYCVIRYGDMGDYEEQLKEFRVRTIESLFRGREVKLFLYDYEKIVDFIKKNSKYGV